MKHNLYLLTLLILIASASAADYQPQRMNYQGYLTNIANDRLTGTYTIDFSIYDSNSGGSRLWNESGRSITVTNGLFDYELGSLTPINISTNTNLYLNVTINGEDMGLTNITQTMFAARAQQANNLTDTNNYAMQNLTVTDQITFALAETIDNIQNGWIRITGGTNITGNISTDNVIVQGSTGLQFPKYQTMWAFRYDSSTPVPDTGIRFNLATGSLDYALLGTNFFSIASNGNPTFGNGVTDPISTIWDSAANDGSFDWQDATDYFQYNDDLLISTGENLFIGGVSNNITTYSGLDILINTPTLLNITTAKVDIEGNITANNLWTPMGEVSIANNTNLTGIAAVNTWTIVNATWIGNDASMFFTNMTNSTLTYTGDTTMFFHIASTLSLSSAGNNDIIRAAIFKNGVLITAGQIQQKLQLAGDIGSTAIHVATTLNTNDQIDLRVLNQGATNKLTVTYANLFAMGMRTTTP